MKKKIISAAIATAMCASMIPAPSMAYADGTEDTEYSMVTSAPFYSEDFEENGFVDMAKTNENGWTYNPGNGAAFDCGNNFNNVQTGSNMIRFCGTQWDDSSLELNLKQSAIAKGIDETVYDGYMTDNIAVSFQYAATADSNIGNKQDGSRNMIELLTDDGKPFMAFEAYTKDKNSDDITLNLIALNESKTENVRYELAKGASNIFDVLHEVTVYVNNDDNTYQVKVGADTLDIGNFGAWIPMSTSDDVGAALQASDAKVGSIKIKNVHSSWYGGIILDNVELSKWTELSFTNPAVAPDKAMSMWYRMPAERWAQSIPLGNGRIGAMVWGGITSDTLSLSEVTDWSGEDHRSKNLDNDGSTDNWAALNNLREEMKKDTPDRSKVTQYLSEMGGEGNSNFGTNRPFGKLEFSFNGMDNAISGYRRSLDLENAVSTVEFTSGGTKYTREAIVSNPDQVIALKYSKKGSGKISFDVNFATEETNGGTGTVTAGENYLEWDGAVYNTDSVTNGVNTFGYMQAVPDGGTVTYDKTGMHVLDANEVVVIVSIGTDFKANENYNQNSKENCKNQLDAAVAKGYSDIKAEHTEDVSKLFNRMKVEIGAKDELKSEDPTDVRYEAIRDGAEIDGSFMSLWYQYARYLMIAGSRENSPLPMNLLGIWNDNVACNMAWTCDYHLDVNTQMNQWMSNSANLSESELPLINYIKNILIPSGQITAEKQYNAEGWLANVATNAWGYAGIGKDSWEAFTDTACGAWIMQEVMNYYNHTGDKEFLKESGFYMLKETAKFFNSFMTQYTADDGKTYWVTIPSGSPENGYVEIMSTYDITLIRDIFEQTLKCYDILEGEKYIDGDGSEAEVSKNDGYYAAIQEKYVGLPDYKITESGTVAEWPFLKNADEKGLTDDGNTNHRHTSHLLGLFPYAQITPDRTPELAAAALESMQRRYNRNDYEHTEWTAVMAAAQYARLKDGENAYKYLKFEADTFTWPNLLSISPEGIALAPCDVYCIDGTLGIAQDLAEMLLQSHSDRLEFLPALPKEWSEGNIEGMSAEGAFDVDFEWKDYTIKSAKITSKSGNRVNILKNAAINWDNVAVYDEDGNKLENVTDTSKLLSFDTKAGKSYTLKNLYGEELQTGKIINDSDSRIKYDGFSYHNERSLPDIGNDIHYSQSAGSSIEFQFVGTGIDVIAEGSSDSKTMEVFIDGESKGKFNAKSDTPRGQKVLYSVDDLDYGNHNIKVVQNEDGGYFEFDAFAVRGQYSNFINDDNPMITYGDGWGRSENRNMSNFDYMGDVHYATENGSSLNVEFSGTGIEVVLEKNSGIISAAIDGTDYDEINVGEIQDASGDRRLTVMEISGLANGSHTLKLTKTGGDWCIVDGFIILNEGGSTFNEGIYELSNLDNGKVLSLNNTEITTTDECAGADNQKWILDYVDNANFRLINAQTGMAVSLGSDNRSLVQEKIDVNSKKQIWQRVKSTAGANEYWLMNSMLGKDGTLFAQIDGEYDGNGGGVAMWYYSTSNHFFWSFEDAGENTVLIKNKLGTYMSVDPSNINGDGASIKTWSKLVGRNQKWEIKYVGDNKYVIKQAAGDKAIVRSNGNIILGSADTDAAKWTIEQKKQNGVLYCIFTNAEDNSELDIGGTKWAISLSDSNSSAPYVYDIHTEGKIVDGGEVTVSYKYANCDGSIEDGSTYKVYMNSSENVVASGTTSESEGFKFEVPSDYGTNSVLTIEITPSSKLGKTGASFSKNIHAINVNGTNMSTSVTAQEDFSDDDMAALINSREKGFTHSGSTYEISVGEKSGHDNAMSILAKDWWNSANVTLDLGNDDNEFEELTGKAYVEFDAMFDAPNYYDSGSKMYVALNNGSTRFAAIRLTGENLDVISLSDGGYRKYYNIASGMDNVYGKWFNFKFYVDTETNKYAVKVNNKFVTLDNGDIWFTATADSTSDPGAASTETIGKIVSLEFGHEWMGANSTLWIDNIKAGTYSEMSGAYWIVDEFSAADGKLEYGKTNNMNLRVIEKQKPESGKIYTALYCDGVLKSIKEIDSDDIQFDARGVYETTVTMDVPKVGGNYTAKVFVWDDSMRPIGDVYETEYNVESPFALPNVFSDNMMLQADEDITVWGTGVPNDTVTVTLKEKDAETAYEANCTIAEDGTWEVTLDAKECGGDYTMTVKCGEETRRYTNIIFGDVYLLAGQSNMEAWLSWIDSQNYAGEKERAENSNIRTIDLLSKGGNGSSNPSDNLPEIEGNAWAPMTFSNANTTSAIGYYFAQELNKETGRPIGYIHAAVGGTRIDRWLENDYVEGISSPWSLYNNRVYPLRKFKLSGVLYYQGESDGPEDADSLDSSKGMSADQYSTIMAALIDNYRELFNNENLPFYYAQLARYSNQNFENIRAAQVWALDKVTNPNYVRMVSNLDEVGNFGSVGNTSGNARHDIHPYGKDEVARRFALLAKHDIYGYTDSSVTGPQYKSMETDGDKLILTFEADGDLDILDKDCYADYKTDELIESDKLDVTVLNGFEIAGEDGIYYSANAEIKGKTVILSCDEVKTPVKARYAFGAYPESPNLTDGSGLPSYTFATEYTSKN